jgi:hypothetical protein
MNYSSIRRTVARSAIALAAALAPSPAVAQNYGTTDQVLSVDATSFLGFGVQLQFNNDGYVYNGDPGDTDLHAPLLLPDGAVVTGLCLYARNEDPANVVALSLQAVKLAAPGQVPGVVTIPGTALTADFHDGYGEVCSGPLSYVFHETADVDTDGTSELVAHRLRAFVPNGGLFALGGARITWHRQVSPPPATATFPDVPTGHPFFQYVEALYAAGITAGYGNGSFGANDPISRGQMAAFLAKALGLHWP